MRHASTLLYKNSGYPGLCQYQELKQAWGHFLTQLGDANGGWDWYATLTFGDNDPERQRLGWTKPGWAFTARSYDRWIFYLGQVKGLHDLKWVRGREYQHWRGVPHFHVLIAGTRDLRRDEAWQWWFTRYGFARILPYDRSLGAGYYLSKYLVKELGDIQLSWNLTSVDQCVNIERTKQKCL